MKKRNEDYVILPFTVVRDTREQAGWSMRGMQADAKQKHLPLVVPIESKKLDAGDYSILGMEHLVTCERKSHVDLVGSLSHDRDRFERELKRIQNGPYEMAWLICEADWRTIFESPPPHSKFSPKAIFRTACSWQVKYNRIHWWMCPGKGFAERTCLRLLQKYYENRERTKNFPSTIDPAS